MHDGDLVQRDAELGGDELRPGGFVALAVWRRPGDNRDRAVRIRPNGGALEEFTFGTEARHLDVGRDADADEPAGLASLLLLGAELLVAGQRQHSLEDGWVVAAVVELSADAGGRLVECWKQVVPAHVSGVDAKLACGEIDHPLDQEDRFRPAGSAVRGDRRLVRVHAADIDLERGQPVAATEQAPRQTWKPDAHRIGAQVGGDSDLETAQSAVGVYRQLGVVQLVPAVRGGL